MICYADFGDKEHVFSEVSSHRHETACRWQSPTGRRTLTVHSSYMMERGADLQPRRQWHKLTNDMFTLSEKERNIMGLEKPLKSQAQAQEKA